MSKQQVSVFMGGTGANTAADARTNLGALSIAGDTMTGTLNVQNVIPTSSNTYNLGSSNQRFKDLWLSNSTIYLGDATISANGNRLVVLSIETSSGINLESQAVAAYGQANSAYGQANLAYTQANSAYGQANLAYTQANSAYTQANNAYGQANSAYGQANAAYTQANSAYDQANLAYTQANSAYTAANNSNLKLGGVITGTLNVTQDIIIGGNVYLEGNTTYINVATYAVEDSLIYLASNNFLTDSVDIGIMGGKNTSGTYSHTGLARDATDGKWKLFDGLPEEGHVGNVVNFANTYLATLVANVEANTLTVVNGVSGNVNFDSGTLFIDSVANKVGIGTTSPGYKLSVAGASGSAAINLLETGVRSWGIRAGGYATNTFDIADFTAGATRLIIDSSGNFGLGVAPSAWSSFTGLQIGSVGAVASADFTGSNVQTLLGNNVYYGSGGFYYIKASVAAMYRMVGKTHAWSYAESGSAGGNISFTTPMTLDASGNLGIGTTSPATTLHVDASGGGIVRVSRLGTGAGILQLEADGTDGAISTTNTMRFQTSSVERMRLTSTGLGITESNNPTQAFNIYRSGSTQAVMAVGNSNTGLNGVYFGVDTAGNAIINQTQALATIFSTSAAERMRIDSAGAVCIGTNSNTSRGGSNAKLLTYKSSGTNYFDIQCGTSGDSGLLFSSSSSSAYGLINYSNSLNDMLFYTNSAERMRILSGGNVGIGTTSPGAKLQVNGGVRVASNTWIDTDNSVNLIRETLFGYSGSYRAVQVGVAGSARAISLGYDVSTNLSGGFTGNEIVIPNNKAMIAALSDNSGFIGVLRIDSANNLCLGGGNYQTLGHVYINNTNGNVGIGTTSPAEKLDVLGGKFKLASGSNGYGWIYGLDTNHSIIMRGDRDGTAGDYTNYHQYGGTLASAKGHKFWTGGVLASQSLRLHIADDGTRINPGVGHVSVGYDGSTESSASSYYFYVGKDWSATNHRINRQTTEGNYILVISAYGGTGINADTAIFYAANTGGASAAATAIVVAKNAATSRSINAGGTVNASGADYAEYMIKNGDFNINKGDICGIDVNGLLTNKFSEAHSFVVKSTNPSYVGGDTWGAEEAVGKKPYLTRKEEGESDEQYAERVAHHEADMAIYNAKLEDARKLVDRIAFAGQVPVNVIGATPGQYIIPVNYNNVIKGIAVTNPTFEEYQISVGKVVAIEEDGRARIIVKVA